MEEPVAFDAEAIRTEKLKVLGAVSLRSLSVDLFPDITIPVILVATFYPGAGPIDIEKTITQPIERSVNLVLFAMATLISIAVSNRIL